MLDDARKSVSRGLALGEVAPDFELPILGDQEQVLRLSDVGGRPIVLIFGSYSCSPFRREISKLNRLYREFSSQVAFHLVYMREEHPDHERVEELDLKQPATLAERAENAAFCASEARIDMPILLDLMDDRVATAYGAKPNRTYLLGGDRRVIYRDAAGPKMKAYQLASAIRKYLSAAGQEAR